MRNVLNNITDIQDWSEVTNFGGEDDTPTPPSPVVFLRFKSFFLIT